MLLVCNGQRAEGRGRNLNKRPTMHRNVSPKCQQDIIWAQMSIVLFRKLDVHNRKFNELRYFISAVNLYNCTIFSSSKQQYITGEYLFSEIKILSKLINYYLIQVKWQMEAIGDHQRRVWHFKVIKIGMAPYRPAPQCSHKDTTVSPDHEVSIWAQYYSNANIIRTASVNFHICILISPLM